MIHPLTTRVILRVFQKHKWTEHFFADKERFCVNLGAFSIVVLAKIPLLCHSDDRREEDELLSEAKNYKFLLISIKILF